MKIKNADIIVSGVGLSDIYFNEDYISSHHQEFFNIKEYIKNNLCDLCEDEKWSSNVEYDVDDSLLKSYSSYKRLTKRDYIVACQLPPVLYLPEMKESDTLGVLQKLEAKVLKQFNHEELVITDVCLRFYSYGNVTITGVFKIRDKDLTTDEYNDISNFVHAFFGIALREVVTKKISEYIAIINKLDNDVCLLKLPTVSDLHNEESLERIKENTLQFAIRTHFIYDTKIKDTKDLSIFKTTLLGEWEKALENVLILDECNIYFGWSHSLYVFDDFNEDLNISKYTVPMEVVMSNWAALQGMFIRIKKARDIFTDKIESNDHHKIKFEEVADDIDDFVIKFEKMITYFDSYTITNNPMYFHLIDLQKAAFLEKNHIERVKAKLIILKEIIEDLAVQQRKKRDRKINRILFIITIFALLNSVQVTYELLTNKNPEDLYHILGIFLGLVSVIVLYLRINKKE